MVIEPGHPFQRYQLDGLACFPGAAMNQFSLVQAVDRFSEENQVALTRVDDFKSFRVCLIMSTRISASLLYMVFALTEFGRTTQKDELVDFSILRFVDPELSPTEFVKCASNAFFLWPKELLVETLNENLLAHLVQHDLFASN